MYYKNSTDQTLITLLKKNDHKAYTELYDRYAGILYAHALRKLNDREEAKDIVQELFTYLWLNRTTINIHGQISIYLYTAIRNRIIKIIAHKTVATRYVDFEMLQKRKSLPSDYLVRENQLKYLIEKEIDTLPPRIQEIFILSRKANLSHKEIASQLKISELTVKKQVSNALKVLRARLNLF